MSDIRQEFEEWLKRKPFAPSDTSKINGDYVSPAVHLAWQAYQAREAEVNRIKSYAVNIVDMYCNSMEYSDAFDRAIDGLREALEGNQ